jgi:hypothetical protein
MNHHRFRTCLECIGQGVLPLYTASPELTRLLQRRAERDEAAPRPQAAPAEVRAETRPHGPTEVTVNAGTASAASK